MKPKNFDQYTPTIGIECHVQLNTATKLFSGASNDERGQAPNMVTSPICFGLPGTLPVLNEKAIELAVKAAIALNAEVGKFSSFDRKHYFYPDLPKGYQITQLHHPIILAGRLEVPVDGKTVTVRIHHAHLEEDAGKSSHPAGADYSLVDLNRAGTPLIEIVSEADMHSATEAKAYVQELYLLMKYAGVTLGDLQHGNMRFDVNVSVSKTKELGTRTETKNLNSFRAVEKAVEYEIKRQIELLEKGQSIRQETRGWDDAKQRTSPQRGKEEAQDYRYFPEPDLPPVELSDEQIAKWQLEMPKLPPQIRAEIEACGIDQASAEVMILQDALSGVGYVPTVLEVASEAGRDAAKFTANFLVHRDIKYRLDNPDPRAAVVPSAKQFETVFKLFSDRELSSNAVDQLLFLLKNDAEAGARQVAEEHNLLQENDTESLKAIVRQVLDDPASQKAVADIKAGETKAIGFLVGQVMKASRGKANPAAVSELISEELKA